MKVDVFFYAVGTNKIYKGHYGGTGMGELLIPNNEQYIIYTAVSKDFFEFGLSNAPSQVQVFPLQIDNSNAGKLFSTPSWGDATFVVVDNSKKPQQVSLTVNGVDKDFKKTIKTKTKSIF